MLWECVVDVFSLANNAGRRLHAQSFTAWATTCSLIMCHTTSTCPTIVFNCLFENHEAVIEMIILKPSATNHVINMSLLEVLQPVTVDDCGPSPSISRRSPSTSRLGEEMSKTTLGHVGKVHRRHSLSHDWWNHLELHAATITYDKVRAAVPP